VTLPQVTCDALSGECRRVRPRDASLIAKRIAKDVVRHICDKVHLMDVRYHPLFERWLTDLAAADEETFGDVMALLTALEVHGRDLDDERREESHPVVTSRYDMHALRRTPPTESTPYADSPPVLRILYAVCRTDRDDEVAVALLGGDKTELGNLWYPANLSEAEHRLDGYCRQRKDISPIVRRGNR
jgi:hypothetical protein